MNDNQLAFELKDIKLEDFHMEEVGSAPRCVAAVRTAAATTDCDSQREPAMGTATAVRPCLGPALGHRQTLPGCKPTSGDPLPAFAVAPGPKASAVLL